MLLINTTRTNQHPRLRLLENNTQIHATITSKDTPASRMNNLLLKQCWNNTQIWTPLLIATSLNPLREPHMGLRIFLASWSGQLLCKTCLTESQLSLNVSIYS